MILVIVMYANVLSGEMLVIICGTIAFVIILIILIYIVIGIKKNMYTFHDTCNII